jgi:hypothetical protein
MISQFVPLSLLLLTVSMNAANGATLSEIKAAPFDQLYDVFYVGTDTTLSASQIAVVPKKIELDRDSASGKARFGLQYSFEAGAPSFVQLTASVRFHYDKEEVEQVIKFVEKLKTTVQPVTSISLGGFLSSTRLFIDMGSGIKTEQLTLNPVPIESATVVSIDLSHLDKSALKELLSGERGIGGFMTVLQSPVSVVEMSPSPNAKALIEWVLRQPVLTVKELERPTEASARGELDTRMSIAQTLGAPEIVSTSSGYSGGWNLQLEENRRKLEHLHDSVSQGTLRIVSNQYYQDAVLLLNNVCTEFSEQIVNLATGETGCKGLEE